MTNAGREDLVVVVGAGVAGLSCARALARGGRVVLVLERARGVGGRCATRRIEGAPVDFGVVFFHGRDPGFLAALAEVDATPQQSWPTAIQGAGRPCQPEAFAPDEKRLAFVEGAAAFPKHLAQGLPVRTGAAVTALAQAEGGALRLSVEGSEPLEARTVVLALATEQSARLLDTLEARAPSLDTARALLGMVRSQPCLTLIARYGREARGPSADGPRRAAGAWPPPWDVSYPESSPVLQLIANDASKREPSAPLVLVYQAHARWSRAHLSDEGWPAAVLEEAGRLLGPVAAHPDFIQPHRWRFARTDRSAELSAPLFLRLSGGARLGLCGEIFSPGAGVEAAWLSGERLARQILAEPGQG